MVIDIETEEQFAELSTTGKVLIDFHAVWCGPCRTLSPILDTVATKTDNNILKVNVDNFQNIAKEYNVRGIPCLIIVDNAKVIETMVGLKTEEELLSALA
jgi:thioredoxin 1